MLHFTLLIHENLNKTDKLLCNDNITIMNCINMLCFYFYSALVLGNSNAEQQREWLGHQKLLNLQEYRRT